MELVGGYHYKDNDIDMVEFHVDAHDDFKKRFNARGNLGGCLSVRFPRPGNDLEPQLKPLLIFGQDESILSQFLSLSHQVFIEWEAAS